MLKICIPEPRGTIITRREILNPEELHDEIIDLNVSKSVHHIGIIRRRMPSFVCPAQSAFTLLFGLVQILDHRRERTMGDKHSLHRNFDVVKAVILSMVF